MATDAQKMAMMLGIIITGFSEIEAHLTSIIASVSDTELGETHILLGRMDARGRLDRLHTLAKYHGRTGLADTCRQLKKHIAWIQDRRNELVHGIIWDGTDETKLLFALPTKVHIENGHTVVEICEYPLSKLQHVRDHISAIDDWLGRISDVLPSPRIHSRQPHLAPENPAPGLQKKTP